MKRYLVKVTSESTRDIPPKPRDNLTIKGCYLFGKGKWTFMQTEQWCMNGTYTICQYAKYHCIKQYGFASKRTAKTSWAYKHAEAEKAKEDAKGIRKDWEYTIDIVEIELE